MSQTLDSVAQLERHEASGMFYNWYDPTTLEVLRVWPEDGSTVYPFLSSVDNGWLAAALMVVGSAEPRLRKEADAIFETMDFGFYYDPNAKADVGLIRGGFWVEQPPGCSTLDNYRDRGPEVYYTCHHYGAFNTEPRIASYIGIATGQIPPSTTSDRGGPSRRRTAISVGANKAESASGASTSAYRSGKARTCTTTTTSCPPGVGRCSRR